MKNYILKKCFGGIVRSHHRVAHRSVALAAGMFVLVTAWDTEGNAAAPGNEDAQDNADNPLRRRSLAVDVGGLFVLALLAG